MIELNIFLLFCWKNSECIVDANLSLELGFFFCSCFLSNAHMQTHFCQRVYKVSLMETKDF